MIISAVSPSAFHQLLPARIGPLPLFLLLGLEHDAGYARSLGISRPLETNEAKLQQLVQQLEANRNAMDKDIDTYRQIISSASYSNDADRQSDVDNLNNIEQKWTNYKKFAGQCDTLLKAGKRQEAIDVMTGPAFDAFAELNDSIVQTMIGYASLQKLPIDGYVWKKDLPHSSRSPFPPQRGTFILLLWPLQHRAWQSTWTTA